jgi:hypothetical protein
MPLILQPMFSDKSREEIEQHLLMVRSRRMAAVAVYYAGVNAKNLHLIARERQRIAREYAMLAKDIEKMNKLELAIEDRLVKLEQHQQELDFHRDSLVEVEDGEEAEQEEDRSKANGAARRQATGAIRSGRAPGS